MAENLRSVRGFFIPEEPVLDGNRLVVPPAPVECPRDTCKFYDKGGCFEDRHHLWWEAGNFQQKPYKGLRALSCFVVKICRSYHDELHTFQLETPKPSRDVANTVIREWEFEEAIQGKYSTIGQKTLSLESGTVKRPDSIKSEIEKLFDEVDELKESKGKLVGRESLLPSECWFAVDGEIVLKAITDVPAQGLITDRLMIDLDTLGQTNTQPPGSI